MSKLPVDQGIVRSVYGILGQKARDQGPPEDLRKTAAKVLNHTANCQCATCQSFNKALGNKAAAQVDNNLSPNGDKPVRVTDQLLDSLKAKKIPDEAGRSPSPSGKIAHDSKPGRRKRISQQLADSLK